MLNATLYGHKVLRISCYPEQLYEEGELYNRITGGLIWTLASSNPIRLAVLGLEVYPQQRKLPVVWKKLIIQEQRTGELEPNQRVQ
jgi:hypothetical protein